MKKFTLAINGTAPLLMHNSRLADKLDPITQAKAAVSSKRKKTDEDDLELSRLEWLGGPVLRRSGWPVSPGGQRLQGADRGGTPIKAGQAG